MNCSAPAPTPTASLSISPSSIAYNGYTNLSYSSTNATYCDIYRDGALIWGHAPASYNWGSVGPYTASFNASITCYNSVGASASSAASLTVAPAPVYYPLTTSVSPAAGGSVSVSPAGGSYTSGTPVTVTPTASAGYTFTGWSGDCTGTGACTVSMAAPSKSVTANFTAILPAITLSEFSPSIITAGQTSSISLTSQNATSCTGTGIWTGNLGATNIPSATTPPMAVGTYSQTVTCTGPGGPVTVMPKYLTVVPAPTAGLAINPTPIVNGANTFMSYSSTNATYCDAFTGATQVLSHGPTSLPATSYGPFTSSFTGTVRCYNSAGASAESTAGLTVCAPGEVIYPGPGGNCTPTYTVTGSAGAGGTIFPSSRPGIISSQATSFIITPDAGYTASVSGCGGSLSGTLYQTGAITSNCTVSATFTAPTPAAPTGFTASPSACGNNWLNLSWNASSGATNYSVYRSGTLVYSGSALAFSDTPLTLGGSYSYTITASNNSGATSAAASASGTVAPACVPNTFALSVSKAGSGSGTVTSSPAGISCGSTCNASFASGTSVTLTVTSASPNTFTGWSGACTGTGSCTVAMDAIQSVTATFTAPVPSLTFSGPTSSASSPLPIGSTAMLSWTPSNVTRCTASADNGATGWSGAANASGASQTSVTPPQGTTTYLLECWNASGVSTGQKSVVIYGAVTTGTLTPTSSACTISLGQSSCTQTLSWTTTNPVGTSAVTSPTGTPSPASGNNSSQSFTVPYNASGVNFFLYNNANLIAQAVVNTNCALGTEWSATSGKCLLSVSLTPDLTAGAVSPASAVAGTATTLSATVSNIGSGSTNASFSNFMQVASALNGTGTITDTPAVSMAALASGISGTFSTSHTFAASGSYSLRVCADKSNSGSAGTIAESNENNNCGAWTNITVSNTPPVQCPSGQAWSGGACLSCNGGCLGNGGTAADPLGSPQITCINGATNPTACDSFLPPSSPAPVITAFSASPSTINNGQSSKLTWASSNTTDCTAVGGFSTGGATNNNIGVSVSPSSSSNYGITCTGAGGSVTSYAPLTVLNPSSSISADDTRVTKSSPATTIHWSISQTSGCTITKSIGGIGSKGTVWQSGLSKDGSSQDTLTSRTTYTLECPGTSSKSLNVNYGATLKEF